MTPEEVEAAEVKARTEKLLREATDHLNSLKAEIATDQSLLASLRKKLDATRIDLKLAEEVIKKLYESLKR